MNPQSPLRFHPIYQKRVWGGRMLESRLGRSLPADALPYGESWDIVDRPEAQSVVAGGPWDGWSLGRLWREKNGELFGLPADAAGGRFPILCKILDARDRLSVQVHPPAAACAALGGEPKDEAWFVLDADPGAELFVGLRPGTCRADLERALLHGGAGRLLHVLRPHPGESIFLPSGRLHAIGAGFLIAEIQQNSDTTYRLHDWDRAGLDGHPRELHPAESLASIDFSDTAPALRPPGDGELAACPTFRLEQLTLAPGEAWRAADGRFRLVCVASGTCRCGDARFKRGEFFLLPTAGPSLAPAADHPAVVLLAGLP
jgi:mannose-6-phosphate isomerase